MRVIVDGYEFNFPKAKELYKFDETDKLSVHYHGVSCLKAVDVMAEFTDFYMWIEIKSYPDEYIIKLKKEGDQRKKNDEHHIKSYLCNNLARKYRETFIYRFAENKIDKPIVYVCLLNFDSALKLHFKQELQNCIPIGKPSNRWKKFILEQLVVVNEKDWVRNETLSLLGTCQHV